MHGISREAHTSAQSLVVSLVQKCIVLRIRCKSARTMPAIANASSLEAIRRSPSKSAASLHRDLRATAIFICTFSLFSLTLEISTFKLVTPAVWLAFIPLSAEARLLFLVATSVLTFSNRCRSTGQNEVDYGIPFRATVCTLSISCRMAVMASFFSSLSACASHICRAFEEKWSFTFRYASSFFRETAWC